MTAAAASDLVGEHLDRLLASWDPGSTAPAEIWGRQFDLGLAWVHFPVGHGGLDAPRSEQERVGHRLKAAGVPSNQLRNFVGLGTAAPSIVEWGTEAQRTRYLRPAFTCEEIWCQLFSEPGAGSDLASVSTRAERDGDRWVLNGHKVWTTMGHVARWGICIARTDPTVAKHRGLTFFLVDMHRPGVEVRPLRQISGEAEFNEVIFTDVEVPDDARLGGAGEGWRVTVSTLMNERVNNVDNAKKRRGSGPIAHALRVWERGRDDGPGTGTGAAAVRRDELTALWSRAEVVRLGAVRAEQLRTSGTPGPEGSILKLAIGELAQDVFGFGVDLLGAPGMLVSDYAFVQPDTMAEDRMGDGDTEVDVVKTFLNARSNTIGGGTSEIQRNTIAERVLGLPAEPRPDRDRPWDGS